MRLLTACILLAVLWYSVPTSVFIREISTTVDDGRVRFVRETPWGDVTAQWQSEITLEDGTECNSGEWGIANYQVIPGNTVEYALGDWAAPCLEAGQSFYLRNVRRVLLFGVIPLRADVSVTETDGR